MAEHEKNLDSHRARALKMLKKFLDSKKNLKRYIIEHMIDLNYIKKIH